MGYLRAGDTLQLLNDIHPLISSIDSIFFCDLFEWLYKNDISNEDRLLLKTMLEQARILEIGWFVFLLFS
jgi:hypothetical protein